MKIIFDHQIFFQQRYGGISRYLVEVARRIPKIEGDLVEIFSPLHINAYLGSFSRSGSPLPNVMCPPWSFLPRRINQANRLLGRALIQTRNDIDIFHETYYCAKTYAPPRARLVLTVHDMIHERFPSMFHSGDRTSEYKRQAVDRSDHIICVSENTRADLLAIFDVPVEKTSVIHLGQALASDRHRDRQRPPTIDPFILYVGERSAYKNFLLLLEAYAGSSYLRREFRLVCFGGGSAFTEVERAFMTKAGVANRVKLLSGTDESLAALYSTAAAFVYPSMYEGFGIPPLEAMAHGCPVACANAGSLPEVVGDAACLFDPYDSADLANKLEDLLQSSLISNNYVARGYRRLERFSWDNCAKETLAVYKSLI